MSGRRRVSIIFVTNFQTFAFLVSLFGNDAVKIQSICTVLDFVFCCVIYLTRRLKNQLQVQKKLMRCFYQVPGGLHRLQNIELDLRY